MLEKFLAQLNININPIEIVIYGAIALIFIAGLFKCIFPIFRNASVLFRAIRVLEKAVVSNEKPVWREVRFMGKPLRHHWQQFTRNAGQLDLRGIPCDLTEYINEDTVIDQPGHSQLADLIPTLLTSMGILGTFIGLTSGLSTVDFSNAEGTIQTIPTLLTGMRFAFATSVAGITCSVVFNVLNRIAVGRARRAITNFEDTFYDIAMIRPLQPDVELLCRQQDEEKRIIQMIEHVSIRLAASMENAIGHALVPLNQSLDTFIRGMTREQVKGMSNIVDQFMSQLNSMLLGQMSVLADSMKVVNEGQAQTQQNFQDTFNLTNELLDNARQMEKASQEIAQELQRVNEQIKIQSNDERGLLANNTVKVELLNEQLEKLTGAVEELKKLTNECKNEAQALGKEQTLRKEQTQLKENVLRPEKKITIEENDD